MIVRTFSRMVPGKKIFYLAAAAYYVAAAT